jgi:AraC family transcriptional regulator of adaptative response/methylated-DNA-[protein]-cysteine methyltransferase
MIPMRKGTDTAFSTDADRWNAVLRRDRRADGSFLYAVRTTGVYCRPTCAARRPHRENVVFFTSAGDAEGAGFRSCKRCTPNDPPAPHRHEQAILRACALIDEAEEPPALKALAAAVGIGPFHLHRLFTAIIGVTPKQYAAARRRRRLQDALDRGTSVTQAIYAAGFGSSSRFYAGAGTTLGMTPSQYKQGAAGHRIRIATAQSVLGWVLVAATEKGICAIDFGDGPQALTARLRARFPQAEVLEDDPAFATWVAQVTAFIETPRRDLALPLDVQGTAFQQRVWKALQQIPPGSTASYAEVARRIGRPTAARAVADACASNVLAVAIPCHRVLRADRVLGGYRWGADRKRALLEREGVVPERSDRPRSSAGSIGHRRRHPRVRPRLPSP